MCLYVPMRFFKKTERSEQYASYVPLCVLIIRIFVFQNNDYSITRKKFTPQTNRFFHKGYSQLV